MVHEDRYTEEGGLEEGGNREAGKKGFRGRGLLQVNRRYTILQLHPDLFHGGGGRRSRASSSQEPVDPVCAWNHGPVFTSKPLNSTRVAAHGRARTSFHARKAFARKAGILVYSKFTRQFYPLHRIPRTEFFSREEIPRIDPSPPPLAGPLCIYSYFILRFWKGNDLSQSFDNLAFLTNLDCKNKRAGELEIKFLFCILERTNDIEFVMLYIYIYISYGNWKL